MIIYTGLLIMAQYHPSRFNEFKDAFDMLQNDPSKQDDFIQKMTAYSYDDLVSFKSEVDSQMNLFSPDESWDITNDLYMDLFIMSECLKYFIEGQ